MKGMTHLSRVKLRCSSYLNNSLAEKRRREPSSNLIDYKPSEKDSTYIDTVVSGVKEHAEQLDGEIAACLRGWTSRLSAWLAIMRLAVYEMQYSGLPAAVAINEAVELTRKLSGRSPTVHARQCAGGTIGKLAEQA